ncbi:LysR family transcriptional regulator, partial [Ruminococcus bicirculans (ex Wegman et al. 2014)]
MNKHKGAFFVNTVQLECFLAVAQYLNFSKAAESVSITQPAV